MFKCVTCTSWEQRSRVIGRLVRPQVPGTWTTPVLRQHGAAERKALLTRHRTCDGDATAVVIRLRRTLDAALVRTPQPLAFYAAQFSQSVNTELEEALADRIVSYRIAIFCLISYRIYRFLLWLYRAITTG